MPLGAIEGQRTDHPLQGETFEGLITALDGIAEAITNKDNTGVSDALDGIASAIDHHKE